MDRTNSLYPMDYSSKMVNQNGRFAGFSLNISLNILLLTDNECVMKRILHLEELIHNNSALPLIELRTPDQPKIGMTVETNTVLFVVRGRIHMERQLGKMVKGAAGEFLFIPSGSTVVLYMSKDCCLILLRIDTTLYMYNALPRDVVCATAIADTQEADIRPLKIDSHLEHYIQELEHYLEKGQPEEEIMRIKTREFFDLLAAFYSREQQRVLLAPILTPDTAFSEFVRHNYERCRTVEQLAALLNLAPKKFNDYFKQVYGTTPYKWMMCRKIEKVRREILEGRKSNQQVAYGNGFLTTSQFYDFCRDKLGDYPSRLRQKTGKRTKNSSRVADPAVPDTSIKTLLCGI
jgi:AraC-like DNA-binding protein